MLNSKGLTICSLGCQEDFPNCRYKYSVFHTSIFGVHTFPNTLLPAGQRGHDDDMSSTSEDEGYPEDMDQDKHDESSDDSDSDRSDADSEGEDFLHRDNDKEREGGEEKKSGTMGSSRLGFEFSEEKLYLTEVFCFPYNGVGGK